MALYLLYNHLNLKVMNKKLIGLVVGVAVLGTAVFYYQDGRSMNVVHEEQEASIEEAASETFDENNDLFSDDADFGDVEAATVAIDTTKAEK